MIAVSSLIEQYPGIRPTVERIPTQAVSTYLTVLQKADAQGQRDGRLSFHEIQSYQSQLQQKLGVIRYFNQFGGAFMGDIFARLTNRIGQEYNAATTLVNHFRSFVDPASLAKAPHVVDIRNKTITSDNLWKMAARHGNKNVISSQDLMYDWLRNIIS